MGRADGWPGLRARYALPQSPANGMDHGIGYEALAANRIDVKDVYSTDAKIARYGLRVLVDDRGYFPRYDAVLLHRADLPQRAPRAWAAIAALEGRIDAATMIRLNAAVENDGRTLRRRRAGVRRRPRRDGRIAHVPERARRAGLLAPHRRSICCWSSCRWRRRSRSACRSA